MSTIEFLWACFLWFSALARLPRLRIQPPQPGKFIAMQALLMEDLPQLQQFSLLKHLGALHPHNLVSDYAEMKYSAAPHRLKYVPYLFVAKTLVGLIGGFVAFLIKVLATARGLHNPETGRVHFTVGATLAGLAFANQSMHMINVNELMMERSLMFVFAGSDARFEKEEFQRKERYLVEVTCPVARVFWTV